MYFGPNAKVVDTPHRPVSTVIEEQTDIKELSNIILTGNKITYSSIRNRTPMGNAGSATKY